MAFVYAQSPELVVQIPAEVTTGTTIYNFTNGAQMRAFVKEPGDFP